MIGLGKIFGHEKYINSVVDDVINCYRNFGFASASRLRREDVVKIVNHRYRVHGTKSIRHNVLSREIIDYLDDNYFLTRQDIELEYLIGVIIAKENLSIAINPKTNELILARVKIMQA